MQHLQARIQQDGLPRWDGLPRQGAEGPEGFPQPWVGEEGAKGDAREDGEVEEVGVEGVGPRVGQEEGEPAAAAAGEGGGGGRGSGDEEPEKVVGCEGDEFVPGGFGVCLYRFVGYVRYGWWARSRPKCGVGDMARHAPQPAAKEYKKLGGRPPGHGAAGVVLLLGPPLLVLLEQEAEARGGEAAPGAERVDEGGCGEMWVCVGVDMLVGWT